MTGAGLEDLLEDLISEEIALSGEKGETPLQSNRSLTTNRCHVLVLTLPYPPLPVHLELLFLSGAHNG